MWDIDRKMIIASDPLCHMPKVDHCHGLRITLTPRFVSQISPVARILASTPPPEVTLDSPTSRDWPSRSVPWEPVSHVPAARPAKAWRNAAEEASVTHACRMQSRISSIHRPGPTDSCDVREHARRALEQDQPPTWSDVVLENRGEKLLLGEQLLRGNAKLRQQPLEGVVGRSVHAARRTKDSFSKPTAASMPAQRSTSVRVTVVLEAATVQRSRFLQQWPSKQWGHDAAWRWARLPSWMCLLSR